MGKRKMETNLHSIKLEKGTVYQTSKGGNYYFRYQVNGERKCISLKTGNQEEAIRKAKELSLRRFVTKTHISFELEISGS